VEVLSTYWVKDVVDSLAIGKFHDFINEQIRRVNFLIIYAVSSSQADAHVKLLLARGDRNSFDAKHLAQLYEA
jgi:hypothetical protein